MGRRKGSKNKPKAVINDSLREDVNYTSDVIPTSLSILEVNETVSIRKVPVINYSYTKTRTKGIEKKINSFVNRGRIFYLKTDILPEHTDYFIDGGGWAIAKGDDTYTIFIGHIKNLLPFLAGSLPIWKNRLKRSYIRRNVKRGIHLG